MFQSIIGFRIQSRFASVILIGLVAKELSSSPLGAHKDVNIEQGEITGHVPKGAPLSLKSTNIVVSSSLTGLPAKEGAPQTAGHPGAQSSQDVDDSDDDDEPVGELGVHPSMARTKSAPSSAGGRTPGETFQNQPKDTLTETVKSSQQQQPNGLATTGNNNPVPAETFVTENQSLPGQNRPILPRQQATAQNGLDSNARNEGTANIFLGTRQPLKLPSYTPQARPEFHNDAKDDINDPLKVDPSDNEVNRFPGSDADDQPVAQTLTDTTKASTVKPGKSVAKISVAAASAKPKLALPPRTSTTSKPSEAITSSDSPDIVAAWPEVLVPLSSRGTVQNPIEALGENLPEIPPAVPTEREFGEGHNSTGETFGFANKTPQGVIAGGPPSISPTAEFSGNAGPQQIFPLGTDDAEINGGRLSEQEIRTATNNFAPNSLTETSASPRQALTHSSLKLTLNPKPAGNPQIAVSSSKQPEAEVTKVVKHSVGTTRGQPLIAFETDETSLEEDEDEIIPRTNQPGVLANQANASNVGGLTFPARSQSIKQLKLGSLKSDVQLVKQTNQPALDDGVEASLNFLADQNKPNNASAVLTPSVAPPRAKPLQLPQQNVSTPPQVKNESRGGHQNSTANNGKQALARNSKSGSSKSIAAALPTNLPTKDSSSVGVAQFAVTIPSELPTTTINGIPVSVRIAKQKGSRKSTTSSPPISRNVSRGMENIVSNQSGPTSSEESWMPNFARIRNNATTSGSNKTERKQPQIGQGPNTKPETFNSTTPIFPEIEQEFSVDETSADVTAGNSSITGNSIFAPQPVLLQPIVNQLNNFTASEFGRLIPHYVEKQKQNTSAANPKVETFGKSENSPDIDSDGEQFEISQNSQIIFPVLSVGAAIQPPPALVAVPNSQQKLRNITQMANFGIPESPKPIIPGEMVPIIPVIQQDLPKPGPFLSNSNASANETFRNLANSLHHSRVDNGLSQTTLTNPRNEDIAAGLETFATPKSRQANSRRTPALLVPSEKPTSVAVIASEKTPTQRQTKATKVHKTTTQDPRILLPIGIGSDSMFDDDGQGYKDKEEDNYMR